VGSLLGRGTAARVVVLDFEGDEAIAGERES
jgi:hypothetical protein